jgi:HemY protein
VAAQGLLRTLACEALSTSRDTDQLRLQWAQLDAHDRTDPLVASRAAIRMAELGAPDEARRWLAPLWDNIGRCSAEACDALALALSHSVAGLEAEWLPRLDKVSTTALRTPSLALAVGLALAERQLWGKARTLLLSAANDVQLDGPRRRQAWVALARLAEQEQRTEEAARYWRSAAVAGER